MTRRVKLEFRRVSPAIIFNLPLAPCAARRMRRDQFVMGAYCFVDGSP